MTAHRHHRRQPLRRAARPLVRIALVVLGVRLGAALAGTVAVAVIGAAAATIGAVILWARIEARLFPAPQPCTELVHPAASAADQQHLAFAQALATVAARYLAECEAEDQP